MINYRAQGSAAVIIVVILAIVIVGALGFVFLQNFGEDKTVHQSARLASDEVSDSKMEPGAYVLADAIEGITRTLADGVCKGTGSDLKETDFVVVDDASQFVYQGGKSLINKDLTHAYVQYGCGSQGVVAFLAKEADVWMLVHETARMYALCNNVRGYKFPSSIVDKCYSNKDAAEPIGWNGQ